MLQATRFTKHAFDRVQERLSLSHNDIVRMYNDQKMIPLGTEVGTEKIHWLFYSITDGQHFVLIRDGKNGEIITILPPDYHNRWMISFEAELSARKLAIGDSEAKTVRIA